MTKDFTQRIPDNVHDHCLKFYLSMLPLWQHYYFSADIPLEYIKIIL